METHHKRPDILRYQDIAVHIHNFEQKTLVTLVIQVALFLLDATEDVEAVALLPLGIQCHQSHKASDLEKEVDQDGNSGVLWKDAHCWHGWHGTWTNNKMGKIVLWAVDYNNMILHRTWTKSHIRTLLLQRVITNSQFPFQSHQLYNLTHYSINNLA